MGCPNILVITIAVCLGMDNGMSLRLTRGIQVDTKSSRHSVATILSIMNAQLSSPFGNCSFPPKEVLNDIDTFDISDICDRRMPSLDRTETVTDSDVIMCLGLLELGFRLCSLEKDYYQDDKLFSLPHDNESFKILVHTLNQENNATLCTDLKKALDRPIVGPGDEHNVPIGVLKKWSLQKVFHEQEESCSRICFDAANKPRLICKLILWGISNVLIQPHPKPFQSLISHSDKINVDPSDSSLVSQGEAEKTGQGTSFNQNVPDEPKGEHVDLYGVNDLETGNGNVVPSSSEITPRPIAETKSDQKPVENKASEVKNEGTDAKQSTGSTKSVQNQSEPHPVLNAVEDVKHSESITEHRMTSIKQEVVIKENPEKSLIKPDTASLDGDKSKDIDFEENPPSVPAEKMPIDRPIAGKGDEVRDPLDPSVNQDFEEDDDLNFPEIQDQNSLNHESTAYKMDAANKFPQDEFSNSNTFIQERFEDSEDSHFFSYFMAVVALCIVGYVVFHNKQKILALALEGRSRRTSRRRPATANYHKLDNNLEEAVSSPCNTSVTHVIY